MQGYLDELELVITKQQHQLVLTVTVITGTLHDLQNLIRFLQAELGLCVREQCTYTYMCMCVGRLEVLHTE